MPNFPSSEKEPSVSDAQLSFIGEGAVLLRRRSRPSSMPTDPSSMPKMSSIEDEAMKD
jgi:hypothetical protein